MRKFKYKHYVVTVWDRRKYVNLPGVEVRANANNYYQSEVFEFHKKGEFNRFLKWFLLLDERYLAALRKKECLST